MNVKSLAPWFTCTFSIAAALHAQPPADPPRAAQILPRTVDAVVLAMLENIEENGFNPDRRINGGLGGLWINWRRTGDVLEVNFNGSGSPDGPAVDPPRHDNLTDLRYLHNLFSYKHQHPEDTRFDAEIGRYSAIVKREFAGAHDERGWIYDEFMHMYHLSGDEYFREAARSQARHFADKLFHDDIGVIYKTSREHPQGYYRVDLALEAGCALVQAGKVFENPQWSAKGERLVRFVYEHAYLPQFHIFLSQMGNVRLADGSANPNQTIYRARFRHYATDGGVVRFGGIGQMILSLLHVFIVTGDRAYLDRADDMLAPLTAETNLLGLWDAKEGGYFGGVEFPGPVARNPGRPQIRAKTKESGRQFHMLQAFHVANCLTGNRYKGMEDAMRCALIEKAYYAPQRGIFYEVEADWTPRSLKDGKRGDWVTSEAMGCAMMALFSLSEKEPW